jgi:protease-4
MWKWSQKPPIDPQDPNRDWRMIEHLLQDAFSEQKKSRRWGVIFKSLTFLYLFVLLILFVAGSKSGGMIAPGKSHVAVVRLDGVISADESASAGKVGEALRNAFKNEHAEAVILSINSPGGSPVQSGYIYDEMRRLKALHPAKKLYAVIADIGASGGYYVAAAADEIYADKSSLVGSIGVTASGFGFVETLKKLGVERRHFTAGEHKAFLDPFSPVKDDEKLFWQDVLENTHQQFIQAVRDGRGERLTLTEEITSGLVWNGEQALALGLIDGLGSVRYVAREKVGQEELRDYTIKDSPIKMLLEDLGVSVGRGLGMALRDSAIPSLQ